MLKKLWFVFILTGMTGSAFAITQATRTLPNTYTPGVSVDITINCAVDADILIYAVEEIPPAGWTVSEISGEGMVGIYPDGIRRIRWVFLDATQRTLTYKVTPPNGETGPHVFSGTLGLANQSVITQAITGSSQMTLSTSDIFQFESASLTGRESEFVTVRVVRLNNSGQALTVTLKEIDGTAKAGTNYVARATNILTFEPTQNRNGILIPLLDDGVVNNLDFTVQLVSASGAAQIGSPSQTQIVMKDFCAITPRIASLNPAKGPKDGNTLVSILGTGFNRETRVLVGGTQGQIVRSYFHAYPAIDVLIPSHNRAEMVSLIIDNCGEQASAPFEYLANADQEPTLSFSQDIYSVPEGGNATLTIRRQNGSTGTSHVYFDVISGSALPGVQYQDLCCGDFTFGPGETEKSIAIPILDDDQVGSREFSVWLNMPESALIGIPYRSVVSIIDNDPAPSPTPVPSPTPALPPLSSMVKVSLPESQIALTNESILLSPTVTYQDSVDPNQISLQAQWSLASGPWQVKFENPHALTTKATFSQPGTYTLSLEMRIGSEVLTLKTIVTVQATQEPIVYFDGGVPPSQLVVNLVNEQSARLNVAGNDAQNVSVTIYNRRGQEVCILGNPIPFGEFMTLEWNGRDKEGRKVPSGLYIARIKRGNTLLKSSKVVVLN